MAIKGAVPAGQEDQAAAPLAVARLCYVAISPIVLGAIYLTLAVAPGWTVPYVDFAVRAMAVYGAVILSFVGGVRWGFTIAGNGNVVHGFVLAILPLLVGWVATLLPGAGSLVVLAAGFVGQGLRDHTAGEQGRLPGWYVALRRRLTVTVVVCLLVGASGLLLSSGF